MRNLTYHPDAAARIEMLMRLLIDPDNETPPAVRMPATPQTVETATEEAA